MSNNRHQRIDDCLSVHDGQLYIEDCRAIDLAQRFGTPLYVVSENQLRRNARRFGPAKFRVFEVEVMNDLGNRPQWRFAEPGSFHQNLKRAGLSLMCKFAVEHIEAEFTFAMNILVRVDK